MEDITTHTVRELFEETLLKQKRKTGYDGIPSGFDDIDCMTGGWQDGKLIVVAAPVAMGKTPFVLALARNTAVNYEKSVAYFSIDLSPQQVAGRLMAAEAKVEYEKVLKGKLEGEDLIKINERTKKLTDAPFYIVDAPDISLSELCEKARYMYKQQDIKLIIIDSLQHISLDDEVGIDNNTPYFKRKKASLITKTLNKLAKELNIPIILVSGLVIYTAHWHHRPEISFLRKMGIAKHVDTVVFIYRPEYYGLGFFEDNENSRSRAEIILNELTAGWQCAARIYYYGQYMKFTDVKQNE